MYLYVGLPADLLTCYPILCSSACTATPSPFRLICGVACSRCWRACWPFPFLFTAFIRHRSRYGRPSRHPVLHRHCGCADTVQPEENGGPSSQDSETRHGKPPRWPSNSLVQWSQVYGMHSITIGAAFDIPPFSLIPPSLSYPRHPPIPSHLPTQPIHPPQQTNHRLISHSLSNDSHTMLSRLRPKG